MHSKPVQGHIMEAVLTPDTHESGLQVSAGVHLVWISNCNDMWSGDFSSQKKEGNVINKYVLILISNKGEF